MLTRQFTRQISLKEYESLTGQKENFLDFVKKSPLKGTALNIKRDKSTARDVDL